MLLPENEGGHGQERQSVAGPCFISFHVRFHFEFSSPNRPHTECTHVRTVNEPGRILPDAFLSSTTAICRGSSIAIPSAVSRVPTPSAMCVWTTALSAPPKSPFSPSLAGSGGTRSRSDFTTAEIGVDGALVASSRSTVLIAAGAVAAIAFVADAGVADIDDPGALGECSFSLVRAAGF